MESSAIVPENGRLVRAVLDTSVLVPPVQRRDLQSSAQSGLFIGIWSPWIVAELNRVLVWRWIDRHGSHTEKECARQAKVMMEILLATFEVAPALPPYPPAWESLPGRWDHPVWAAAKEASADIVISDNTRHYPPRDKSGRHIHEGIEYVPARRFLSELTRGLE